MPNWASWASACIRVCIRRAFRGIPAAQVILFSCVLFRVRYGLAAQTSARLSLKRARFRLHSRPAIRRHAECAGYSTERVSSDPGGPTRYSTKNPLRTTRQRVKRRGLLGFAGLAPHSGRSPRPVPNPYIPEQEAFPFYNRDKISPDKAVSIGKNIPYVKIKSVGHF